MLCQIVMGPQFPNFTFKYCLLTWRRASENFDRYFKMGTCTHKCLFKQFLKPAPRENAFFILFLKLPSEWRDFSFVQVKNANKTKLIFIYKVPVIFWKWKLCRACNAKFADFFYIKLLIIYLIGRNVSIFENRTKVFKITPPYCIVP